MKDNISFIMFTFSILAILLIILGFFIFTETPPVEKIPTPQECCQQD